MTNTGAVLLYGSEMPNYVYGKKKFRLMCIHGDRRPSLVLFDSLHFWLNYDLVYNPLNNFFQVCKNFETKMLNKVPFPLLTQTRTEQLLFSNVLTLFYLHMCFLHLYFLINSAFASSFL